jgi:hypothetical protein
MQDHHEHQVDAFFDFILPERIAKSCSQRSFHPTVIPLLIVMTAKEFGGKIDYLLTERLLLSYIRHHC